MDNFLLILQRKFDTFLVEIAELSNARVSENRLNTFLVNFEVFRENNLKMKENFTKKIKIIDKRNHHGKFNLTSLVVWEPVLTEFNRKK